jgi:hypothetical protein
MKARPMKPWVARALPVDQKIDLSATPGPVDWPAQAPHLYEGNGPLGPFAKLALTDATTLRSQLSAQCVTEVGAQALVEAFCPSSGPIFATYRQALHAFSGNALVIVPNSRPAAHRTAFLHSEVLPDIRTVLIAQLDT